MRLLVPFLLMMAVLSAADVSGKWRGSIYTDMATSTGGQIPAYMELRQADGNKVTGSAGANEKAVYKIERGSVEGDQVTVVALPMEDSELRFVLTVRGSVLEGDVLENGRKIGIAKLTRE